MGNVVVVLGAGASRAAGEAYKLGTLDCYPPLNADFFVQLQRITGAKHLPAITKVIDDIVDLFGSNFHLTLEDYFTQLEFLSSVVNIAYRNPEVRQTRIGARQKNLIGALAAVLESSTDKIIRGAAPDQMHTKLITELKPGDSIISFNYDCLVDDALRRSDGIWNPVWGYSFPAPYRISGSSWTPGVPAKNRKSSIRLYKLHGSVNWQLPTTSSSRTIRLKERLHRQRGTPKFSIVPPVWNKAISEGPIYQHLWRRAAGAVRRAEVIAVIGFSFASTDLYAQSLFRIAVEKSPRLKLLVIAEPNRDTRVRIREVFDVPLAENHVIVRQYKDFHDFSQHSAVAFTRQ